ncbi:MAG: pyruvate, phosphate dikinase [Firmicutes bacterium]|nr:pyruvate, phosphate dikinase [Bacillota bacterium]
MAESVMTKMAYLFEEGNGTMKDLLGGKGAGLAEMTKLGFPVPPGFTITTEMCNEYRKLGKKFPAGLKEEIRKLMTALEEKMGKKFGDPDNALLVSVRSGAKFSMPGMMDTILNLGLNEETLQGLIKQTGNERFAYDANRRFIQMFSDVVLGLEKKKFEIMLEEKKRNLKIKEDQDVPAGTLKELIGEFKKFVLDSTGSPFPEDPYEQLYLAIEAVFKSWDNPRAVVYRNKENISHDLGTAVNVQVMVFGNMGDDCGTGVAFTRDASSGKKEIYGDFLMNAQGEDVVAGIRTPTPISRMKELHPEIYKQLEDIAKKLETHFKDLQDLEFTIERGKLYMLQTRSAKRTAIAAVKVAVDLVKEGLITKEDAVSRVTPDQIDQLLHPYFLQKDKEEFVQKGNLLAKGTPASPGAAAGIVVFEARDAIEQASQGNNVILVRPETSPDDAQGMLVSKGILTSTGGPTSHAALVARGWGIPCVVGCEAMTIDPDKRLFISGGKHYYQGETLSIDGTTGEVFLGALPTESPNDLSAECKELLSWADEIKRLGVYANADNPRDAQKARNFGAQGIGLCRTEHMFMESDRLPIVQDMIMAAPEAVRLKAQVDRLNKLWVKADEKEKVRIKKDLEKFGKALDAPWKDYRAALDKLLPIQREDFRGILKAMEGLWTIIRLLDPPLHEFLPSFEDTLVEVTTLRLTKTDPEQLTKKEALLERLKAMREFNPMLGLRVCRLGIVYPEIYEMQVQAIFEAACELKKEGVDVKLEVMIPGVGHVNEMKFTRDAAKYIAEKVMNDKGIKIDYKIGTMVELPRACVAAGELAKYAQFFSFGTNDLTQTTYGYSRDDAAKSFIPVYVDKGILEHDPFLILDREGVGSLMKLAVEQGRKTNPDIEIGICGEHGGEPSSVEFCHFLGLNYVSCSPYRVPIARLSAAQAKLKEDKKAGSYENR